MYLQFDKRKTSICKGIAAIMLVIHHLFYLHPEIAIIGGRFGEGVPYLVSHPCRACVAIFTLLSGYGIEKSVGCSFVSVKQFYSMRLKRFYLNYLFYVVISLLFMALTGHLLDEYAEGNVFFLRLALSLSGMQYLVKNLGLNIVWWYVTMLMCCYISFPIVNRVVLGQPRVMAVASALLVAVGVIRIGRIGLFEIASYAAIFYLGCLLACGNNLERAYARFGRHSWLVALGLAVVFLTRLLAKDIFLVSRYLDVLFSVLLMLAVLSVENDRKPVWDALAWLGSISMSIYYIHQLYIQYVSDWFIYDLPNAMIMFVVVMAATVGTHYLIEGILKAYSRVFVRG